MTNSQTLKIFVALQGVHNVFEEVYRGSVRYTEKKVWNHKIDSYRVKNRVEKADNQNVRDRARFKNSFCVSETLPALY